MLFLKEHETCPYSVRCPHSTNCWGTKSDRNCDFTCALVDNQGRINESGFRNPLDKTGKMKVIMENA